MDEELSRITPRAIFHQNELLHYIIVIKSWTNVMTEDDVCFEEKNDWSENDELSHFRYTKQQLYGRQEIGNFKTMLPFLQP